MDRKEARRLGEVMIAWADGRRIEYLQQNSTKWEQTENGSYNLAFDFAHIKYRMPSEFQKVSTVISDLSDSIVGKDVQTKIGNTFSVIDRTVTAMLVCVDDRNGAIVLLNSDVEIKIIN